jgi:hypothetical protein
MGAKDRKRAGRRVTIFPVWFKVGFPLMAADHRQVINVGCHFDRNAVKGEILYERSGI